MSDQAVISDPFMCWLADKGLVPPECSRVIVDARASEILKIYYTCNGTDSLLSVEPPPPVLGARIVGVDGL